jgi:hypothetical protein
MASNNVEFVLGRLLPPIGADEYLDLAGVKSCPPLEYADRPFNCAIDRSLHLADGVVEFVGHGLTHD